MRRTDHRRHHELDVRITSIATIRSLHRVGEHEIAAVTGARELWTDVLVILAPVALLFGLVSDRITRRVDRSFDVGDRWPKLLSLAALAPIIAAFGLMVTQLWEWLVEWVRLGNSHLSYRAFRLPGVRHAVLIWICAMVVFAFVALIRLSLLRQARRHART